MEVHQKKYVKIYYQYQWRIRRFKCGIEKQIYFIKADTDNKEVEYIQNQYDNIKKEHEIK